MFFFLFVESMSLLGMNFFFRIFPPFYLMFYPQQGRRKEWIRKCFNELSKKIMVVQTVRAALEYIEVVGMLATMCIIKKFKFREILQIEFFLLNRWDFFNNIFQQYFIEFFLFIFSCRLSYLLKIILKKYLLKAE